MAGFTGVDKEGRRARRGKCGGDFIADMAAFTHSGNNDPAFALQRQFAGFFKVSIELGEQVDYGIPLHLNCTSGGC